MRSAYRRLCRIYHPDRHHDIQRQESASDFFHRIQEAYRVLSDPRMRAIYDRSGKEGVERDMVIIERTSLPSELLEEYEKLKSLWEERTYIQQVNPHGMFQMDVDATPLVDEIHLQDKSSISIQKVTVTQSVDAQLTKSAFGNVAGTVSTTQQSLFGGLQFSLRHLLSNQNWVKVSAMVGSQPALGFETYHNLSSRMYLTSNSLCSLTPYGFMVSANGTVTRRLNDSTSASLSLKETGNVVAAQAVHRLSSTTDLVGETQVGYTKSFVKGMVHYHPESKYSLKAGALAGTEGLTAFYGAEQEVAVLTRIGGMVLMGTDEGVVLKLRFIRALMTFTVRIHISHVVSIPAVFYASMVPLVLYGCFKAFAVAPLLQRQRQKEFEDKKAEKEKEVMKKKKEAESAIELMKETVERVINSERARQGLLILEASYGKLFGTEDDSSHFSSPKVIDVHIPLQCLVVDSKLILRENTKANIPGFYNPCVGEKKYLRVRYEFRGTPHEVTIENSEPLIIPRKSHRIVNLVD